MCLSVCNLCIPSMLHIFLFQDIINADRCSARVLAVAFAVAKDSPVDTLPKGTFVCCLCCVRVVERMIDMHVTAVGLSQAGVRMSGCLPTAHRQSLCAPTPSHTPTWFSRCNSTYPHSEEVTSGVYVKCMATARDMHGMANHACVERSKAHALTKLQRTPPLSGVCKIFGTQVQP